MSPEAAPSVSVVIVNYNVRYLLEQCLRSLYRSRDKLNLQIIVVDNASSDHSIEYLTPLFPEVEFIAQSENVGFSRANNIGVAACTGEYLLILNPDTIVGEETLQTLTKYLSQHPEVGMVTPKLIRKDGALDLACRRSLPSPWVAFTRITGLSRLFPSSRLFAQYNLTYLDENKPTEVGAVTGAFMLMRRVDFHAVGGFDEQFFMFGEDLDLCAKIQSLGKSIQYRPEVTSVHYRGESTRRSTLDRSEPFYGAMILYAEKHYHGWSRSFTLPLLKLGIHFARWMSGLSNIGSMILFPAIDAIFVALAFILGNWVRWGSPTVWIEKRVMLVNVIIVLLSLAATGAYAVNDRKMLRATFNGAVFAVFVSGTITFFLLRDIMFSRGVVLISGVLWIAFLPTWRTLLFKLVATHWLKSWMRRIAIIVGTDEAARALGTKLLETHSEYEFVGFVRYPNEVVNLGFGVDPLGATDSLEHIVTTERVTDVFFSTGGATYATIFDLANRLAPLGVHFKVLSADSPGSALPLFGVDWKTPIGWRSVVKRMQRRWRK